MSTTPRQLDDGLPPLPPNNDEAERRFKQDRYDPALAKNPTALGRMQRELLVERMLLEGITEAVTCETVAIKFKKSPATIRKDISNIRARWVEEDSNQRATYKSTAMRRIQGHIHEARKDRAWGAVGSLERLLSQIQGTMEPIEVAVDVVMKEALVDYLGSMSMDELETMAAEQADIERKAAMFERGISPDDVIDTEGLTIR